MGPAAVLSVLVNADTAPATVQLTKFDKQLAATSERARKGIRAQLGASFDSAAFSKYDERLSQAARRAKDRAAFKAELGANFNASAFNAYERAVTRAESTSKTSGTRMNNSFSSLRSGIVATGGAFVGFSAVVGSLQASANFEKAMTLVHTQAGYAEADVKRLTRSVMDMAPKVGFGPDQLAKSLFHIASAGVPASNAMEVLKAAAMGARVGAADLEQTTNALVGIMRTAPKDVKGASDAMGTLSAIVGQGNMRMDDLTAALSTGVLPAAKTFGLGLKDVGAALDVMTSRGMPAELSATRLRMTFSMMEAPTKKAADALKSVGMSSDQMANDMRKPGGLVIALSDLKQHLDKSGMSAVQQAQVISHAFGGGRTSAGVMLLLQNVDDLKKHTDALQQQKGTAALDAAFKKTQSDTAANLERLKATFQAVGITLGNAIAPALPTIVKMSQSIAAFIAQMRSGQGAGGSFARTLKDAFDTVKSVLTALFGVIKTVVGAVGGLGNALKIAIAMFATAKIAAFAIAIGKVVTGWKGLTAAIASNPIGAAVVVVGLLAAAILGLTHKTYDSAAAARAVRDAWRDATDAARGLRDAELNVSQVKLDQARASKTEKDAQVAVTNAARDYGKNSPQYRAAVDAEKQANLDLKRANNSVHDSTQDVSRAQQELVDKYKAAIQADKDHRTALQDLVTSLKITGASTGDVNKAQTNLDKATGQLNKDQLGLNQALDGMPKSVSSTVGVNIDFASNITGAVASIAQSIGSSFTGHFATGGMVNAPGYFAGEEAPRHPEVILATNPAYRQRNLGLWSQAGSMLGVPGFATGGVAGAVASGLGMAGPEVTATDPWAAQKGEQWMAPIAQKWAQAHGVAGRMIGAANSITGLPYVWGGGHGGWSDRGYDCSGAVSFVLHAGGFLGSPLDTVGLDSWGAPGPGQQITVGVRGGAGVTGHTMMEMFGKFFESGGSGGGPHWDSGWDGTFTTQRHPPGFAKGGITGDFGDVPPSALLKQTPELVKNTRFQKYLKQFPHFQTGGVAWNVMASAESDGGSGYYGFSPGSRSPSGYSILGVTGNTSDGAAGAGRAFGAIWPAGTDIWLRAAGAAGSGSRVTNQDIGAGDSYQPSIGIYPAAYGVVGANSNWNGPVDIQRVDGAPFQPNRSNVRQIAAFAAGATGGGAPAGKPVPTIHYPTGPVWGKHAKGRKFTIPPGWQQTLMHMPKLPKIKSAIPDTPAGASGIQGRIDAGKALIANLENEASTLDSYYTIGGASPTAAQSKLLVKMRQQIFDAYQWVVVRTYRLIEAYKRILDRLKRGLASIKTKGLSGDALKAAGARQKATQGLITNFSSKLGSANSDLSAVMGNRDTAWVNLLTTTQTAGGSPTTTTTPPDQTIELGLLQTALREATMRTAVSESQFKALTGGGGLVGAFAAGGVLSRTGWALVGEQGPELAHLPGGTHIYPNTQSTSSGGMPVIQIVIEDGAVDPNKIKVIAGQEAEVVIRREVRSGMRQLAGRGGGVIRG